MLSRQNLPMPLLRVVLQFLSLAVSVMDILVMSQDEASARRTKRARAHYHERAPLYCCDGARAYGAVAISLTRPFEVKMEKSFRPIDH